VDDDLISHGRIDTLKLDPLARLAGNFSKVESMFDLPLAEAEQK
jgi:hypothetical protein